MADNPPDKIRRLFYGPCDSPSHSRDEEPPDPMTQACLEYFRHDAKVLEFIGHDAQLGLLMSALKDHAKDIEMAFKDEEAERKFGQSFVFLFDTPRERLAEHSEVLYQMLFCAAVNNYLTYVSDLLSLMFRSRPETLRSSQTMELSEILRFGSIQELVGVIADRRVYQLAYKGMGDLNRELARSLGLALFRKSEELRRAKVIIEVRNLIVHGRAIVNSLFMSRLGYDDLKVGERIRINVEEYFATRKFLSVAVSRTDREAAEKFGLPRPITRESCGL